MIKDKHLKKKVAEAKKAAIEVLLHNNKGPFNGFPRTAGWGYPEPYTRDLMIASLGILLTDNQELIDSLRNVLEALAKIQTEHGHIHGWLREDKISDDSSDTTPLFILAVGFFREKTGEKDFLEEAVKKAMTWMKYQSPNDSGLVYQSKANDWRDEQWFYGTCIFVNTIVYSYLKIFDQSERAELIRKLINCPVIGNEKSPCIHSGLLTTHKNFYAICVFKTCKTYVIDTRGESIYDRWFDLLGNSLAILSKIASPEITENIISWVEKQCKRMQNRQELALDLPPVFFPYIYPYSFDPNKYIGCAHYDWYNNPGEYHNGGIWPFVCGFYVAALVAAGKMELAEKKLAALTDLVKLKREPSLPDEQEKLKDIPFGFNEWIRAQNGVPMGENWQTWSASMYLYAVKCVETGRTPFFDKIQSE